MSNLEPHPQEAICGGTTDVADFGRTGAARRPRCRARWHPGHAGDPHPAEQAPPDGRRLVLRRPLSRSTVAMQVPPHPHTGLQTVTWLVEGEVRHRDSLGNDQVIRPGQLNLMTAGRGHRPRRGVAGRRAGCCTASSCGWRCPTAATGTAPDFAHHARPAAWSDGRSRPGADRRARRRGVARAGVHPARRRRGRLRRPGRTEIPLEPDFEYAVLTLVGTADVDGGAAAAGPLLYLGTGRERLRSPRRRRPAAAPRRRAVRRRDRHVVELHRPQPRGDRGQPGGLDGRSPLRDGLGSTATRCLRRRCRPRSSSPRGRTR